MLTGDNTRQGDHFASPEHLRIGLYVFVDLPWFRHPFTLNSFRISSADQISELRALRKSRFRYDPARSEAAPAQDPTVQMPPAAAVPVAVTGNEDLDNQSPGGTKDSSAREQRDQTLAMTRAERSFKKAIGIMRRIDRNLLSQPQPCLQEITELVGQMVCVFLERPDVTLQIMGENCGGEEACHHGLNVTVLCLMLAKGLDLDKRQAEKLGTAALLHDIGLTEIPTSILKKSPEEHTRAERELRAQHLVRGLRIGRQLGLDPDVLSVIEQHHEMADGSGYPYGLKLEQITPLSRVVSLINYYENLCNPVDFLRALTPHESLSLIFARRKSQFDARVLALMVRSLGVYPPGSFVHLSNEALAMVVSVNPHKPLRPWVRVYNAAIPKEAAVLLNLERESDLSISRSVRPLALPAPVHAYLSARRRITYFFDGETPSDGARP